MNTDRVLKTDLILDTITVFKDKEHLRKHIIDSNEEEAKLFKNYSLDKLCSKFDYKYEIVSYEKAISSIDLDKVRAYCENLLREVQIDNLYFGQDKGSIYWVEGAECWCYQCGDKTDWGQADDLLSDIDDKILFSYYEENKEEIDYYLE